MFFSMCMSPLKLPRIFTIPICLFSLSVILTTPLMADGDEDFAATTETVGRNFTNRLDTPVNQRLTPAGIQVELPGMRPQALALSPDQDVLLVTSGMTHELVTLDPVDRSDPATCALPTDNDKNPHGETGFQGDSQSGLECPSQLYRPRLFAGRFAHLYGKRRR